MDALSGKRWSLDRYARFVHDTSAKGGSWKITDDKDGPLYLNITDTHQLLITQGSNILESHNLVAARTNMRATTSGNSLLIMHKTHAGTRKFRGRFCDVTEQTGEETCNECALELANFISLKSRQQHQQPGSQKDEDQTTQPMDDQDQVVTLGQMAKNLLSGANLPEAYHHCALTPDLLTPLLHMCLSDPTFPAFVEQVGTELDKLMSETN